MRLQFCFLMGLIALAQAGFLPGPHSRPATSFANSNIHSIDHSGFRGGQEVFGGHVHSAGSLGSRPSSPFRGHGSFQQGNHFRGHPGIQQPGFPSLQAEIYHSG